MDRRLKAVQTQGRGERHRGRHRGPDAALLALVPVLVLATYWPGMVLALPNLFQSAR